MSESGVRTGAVIIAVTGSTAAVTTIEYESGALADLRRAHPRGHEATTASLATAAGSLTSTAWPRAWLAAWRTAATMFW